MEMKKQKNIFLVLIVCAVTVLFCFFVYRKLTSHPVTVYSEKGAQNGTLVPLNAEGKRATVNNGSTACFRFTDIQKLLVKNTFQDNKNVSVVFRFTVKFPAGSKLAFYEEMENIPLKFGFIEKKDLDKNGKLDFDIKDHTLVICDLKNTLDYEKRIKTYDIALALPFDKFTNLLDEKEGVFFTADVSTRLQSIKISESYVGFDLSGDIQYYGFSSNGGNLNFTSESFDFTGCSNIFPVVYSNNSVPPDITIKMTQPEEKELEKLDYSISFGGEKLNINRLEAVTFSSLALKRPFANMAVRKNSENLLAVLFHSSSGDLLNTSSDYVVTPIKVDPGLITSWPRTNWRCEEYELFEWDRLPGILFFDTKNYAVQTRFFARMAFFTEKAGYKGKILTDEELKGKHDYNAHDYSAESFAKFFNKAFRLNFRLNQEEELLLEILVRNGLLERTDDSLNPYVAKGGAVLSISREIPSYNRVSLLAHEGWHTIFFTDSDFRDYVSVVYSIFDSTSRNFLIDYFKSQSRTLGYDTEDEYLMHNEFMAYILQNREGHAGEYFVTRAKWPSVQKYTPNLCEDIINNAGSGFDDCLLMLQDFLYDKYNLKAGSIGLCSY